MENMQQCHDLYLAARWPEKGKPLVVVELGSADVNGSYRRIFAGDRFRYLGCDCAPGAGVDLVLTDPYCFPLPDAYADAVISGQMFEHCEFFWRAFAEMIRILTPDGFLFLIAPSAGPYHANPLDCYRFYPDAFRALAKFAGCQVIRLWQDDRGPWNDLVGVFRRTAAPPPAEIAKNLAAASEGHRARLEARGIIGASLRKGTPEQERIAGPLYYLDVLEQIHEALAPSLYLEIGVQHGRSLALARGRAVGVDPAPETIAPLPPRVRLCRLTSDQFFYDTSDALEGGVDFALIDGLHWAEFALRDFMNIERYARPEALIVFDDIFPNHPAQADRRRTTQAWCGDVWKIAQCLAEHRPDLTLLRLDVAPAGLLLVAGLNPAERRLCDLYNPIAARLMDDAGPVPTGVLSRAGAVSPADPRVAGLLALLKECASAGFNHRQVGERLRRWRADHGFLGEKSADHRDFSLPRTRDESEIATAAPSPSWSTAVPSALLSTIQTGVMQTRYRDLAFLKSPFDIALYLQLIDRLRPYTIIEIGTNEGGSALWFADTLSTLGIPGRIVTIDTRPPAFADPRITVLQGDAAALGLSLPSELLDDLDHPFLVVEDSAHRFDTTLAVLEFFHPALRTGDYIVIEDGVIGFLPEPRYRQYEDGPNRAVAQFLDRHREAYAIDRSLCDFYGANVTYNPNAWLQRR
jgi:cephalosporin hydroxylase